MSRPDRVEDTDLGRSSAEGEPLADGTDAVTFPGERVVCRNDGAGVTELTIVSRDEGRRRRDTVALASGDAISLPFPAESGPVTVEVYGPDAMAVTSVVPGEGVPLFVCRDGAVLVVCD